MPCSFWTAVPFGRGHYMLVGKDMAPAVRSMSCVEKVDEFWVHWPG